MPNPYEASWFLSALAQCAAAIAAIVGGFITSYLLSHSQEKRRLQNELRSAREELDRLSYHHNAAKQYAKSLIQHLYLVQIRRRTLFDQKQLGTSGLPPVHELLQGYRCDIESLGLPGIYPADMEWLENQISELRIARRKQLEEFTAGLLASDELPDADSAKGVGELWASDLEYIRDKILEVLASGYPPERKLAVRKWLDESHKSVPPDNQDYTNADIERVVELYDGHLRGKRRQMELALDSMHTAKLKADIAQARLMEALPIQEVKWGLACVALLLVLGVVLPLVFLAWEGFASRANLRWIALGCFCFSLAVLGGYLIWLTLRLVSRAEKGDSTSG